MEKNNQNNEELQSRREFFKKVVKKTLPILGTFLLLSVPDVVKASDNKAYQCLCTSCVGTCEGRCITSCFGGCHVTCLDTCKHNCKERCYTGCKGGCVGTCSASCSYGAY